MLPGEPCSASCPRLLQATGNSGSANGIHQQDKAQIQEVRGTLAPGRCSATPTALLYRPTSLEKKLWKATKNTKIHCARGFTIGLLTEWGQCSQTWFNYHPALLTLFLFQKKKKTFYYKVIHAYWATFGEENTGNSLAVQWLGLHAFTAMGLGSIPAWGTEIPQDTQWSQKKKYLPVALLPRDDQG